MNNNFKNPKYYFIDRDYLVKIFGEEFVKQSKYDKRPFIGFDNSNILIAIPQRSVQPSKPHKFHYPYNLYLDKLTGEDKQRYLKIDDFIYVPVSKRQLCSFNNDSIHRSHLLQIEQNIPFIVVVLKEVSERLKMEMGFSLNHRFISKSKKLCEDEQSTQSAESL